VQVRDGISETWTTWISNTVATSEIFTIGLVGHTYYFRSIARDEAGNVETNVPADGDSHTTLAASMVVGRVTNNRDRPIFNATISAQPDALDLAHSDANGYYELYFGSYGTYTLTASCTGCSTLPSHYNVDVAFYVLPYPPYVDFVHADFVVPPVDEAVVNGEWETGDLTGWHNGAASTPPPEPTQSYDFEPGTGSTSKWCRADNNEWASDIVSLGGSNAYYLAMKQSSYGWALSPRDSSTDNFRITANFNLLRMNNSLSLYDYRGDRFGLLFTVKGAPFDPNDPCTYNGGQAESGIGFYRFIIKIKDDGSGYQTLLTRRENGVEPEQNGNFVDLPTGVTISRTGWNTMRIDRSGANIKAYINDTLVQNWNNSTGGTGGWFGLFTETNGNNRSDYPFEADWDNIVVYNLSQGKGRATVEKPAAHSGRYGLKLDSSGETHSFWPYITQSVSIPTEWSRPTLSWMYHVTQGNAGSKFLARISGDSDVMTQTVNMAPGAWTHTWSDLSAFRGQTVTLSLGFQNQTGDQQIYLDEVSLGESQVDMLSIYLPITMRN
jgi:hypothetical protein